MREVSPEELAELAGPALRAFFRISERWSMSQSEQLAALGLTSAEVLLQWNGGQFGGFSADALERISLILGIFNSLNALIPVREIADQWLRAENTAPSFAGRCAMERIASGSLQELIAVRQYLDAEVYR